MTIIALINKDNVCENICVLDEASEWEQPLGYTLAIIGDEGGIGWTYDASTAGWTAPPPPPAPPVVPPGTAPVVL